MNRIPMLDNICGQPISHRGTLASFQGSQRTTLLAAAELIREAKGKVIFSGMGASLFAAAAAVSRLVEQGHTGQAVESSELLHYGSALLRAGDVGIVVSRSGGSIEPVRLAEKMRAAGMNVVAVTNVPGSALEKIADITLHMGALPDHLIAIQTYTGTVLTLLLLAEEVLSQSTKLADTCSAALPALASYIEECVRASETWADFLVGSTLYLLGRGPALGSVHEGALLMHETAKTPAVGMSSGQFRHGPAEILSAEFRAVVFGSPAGTRELDRALANDLCSAGGKALWIGPGSSQAPSPAPWPEIAPVLAPLFEIVPVQVAAYRLALARGVTPGDFRFVSEVTAAESGFLVSATTART